jgi:ATP-dependent DNA helicase RecQ
MTELRRLAALDPDWDWSQVAVIAREWKYLDPVRSYCELHAIPVQLADEQPPSFWRLRETQQLVAWLRERPSRLVDCATLAEWLAGRPHGPWWALLHEAVDDYALETGGAELPMESFVEWLAEWGREVRRKQNGLLLLTAHRAKGLEFAHVVVLDGGWERCGANEDRDAPRRLYYVAMTRARLTLALARMEQEHPILDALPEGAALLRRPPVPLPAPDPALARRYRRLTPKDVNISFAGRCAPSHAVHAAIARLEPGDPIQLENRNGHWDLVDDSGQVVGRLAAGFRAPADMTCVQARVVAVVTRRQDESQPEHAHALRCERWELVLPELTFAPVDQV